MRLMLFGHLLGSAMWIGGALAGMLIAFAAREEPPAVRAGLFRTLAKLHTMVIGIGAMLAVTTGIVLTMWHTANGGGDIMREPRLWVMQGTGLLGGILVMFMGLPTAVKMGGLAVAAEDGTFPRAFEMYRRRQAVISSIAGVLAIVALLAWKVL
jgi:hypothetical protein